MLGGTSRNFVRTKLRPPGYGQIIAAAAIICPGNCQWQFPGLILSCHALGIEAESPQDLHWQIRGLGA
jgi:hypothetical protein